MTSETAETDAGRDADATAVDFQLDREPNGYQAPYFLARERALLTHDDAK